MISAPDDTEKLQKNPAGNWFDFNVDSWLHITAAYELMASCIQNDWIQTDSSESDRIHC
jgi:hypothetical protein